MNLSNRLHTLWTEIITRLHFDSIRDCCKMESIWNIADHSLRCGGYLMPLSPLQDKHFTNMEDLLSSNPLLFCTLCVKRPNSIIFSNTSFSNPFKIVPLSTTFYPASLTVFLCDVRELSSFELPKEANSFASNQTVITWNLHQTKGQDHNQLVIQKIRAFSGPRSESDGSFSVGNRYTTA